MTIYVVSILINNQIVAFDPLHDVLLFDTAVRPAELLINGTASGVQFSVGGKSIVLANVTLDDLGVSSATSAQNVQFSSSGILLVGERTTGHDGNFANIITGGTGDDALLGLGGNDQLDGGKGGDLLVGGLGNDTYMVDNAADIVTEENNSIADAGLDIVRTTVSYVLTNYVENLTLDGMASINGTGNTLGNLLLGNGGDNILDGKAGSDTMIGGDGSDTYFVDFTTDTVIETSSAVIQNDTINSTIGYSIVSNVENLVLIGTASIGGRGNHLGNHLTGNGGANTLNGEYGADSMIGGDGNDTFIVDSMGDTVLEASNSTSQTDMVASYVSYTLDANLENLRLLGTANINATGNAANNILFANAGNNILDGQGGTDTASWASVNLLTLVKTNLATATTTSSVTTSGVTVDLNNTGYQDTQGSGFDKLIGVENLTGSGFNDELTGNAVANILDGNLGADLLTGGKGNDTYIVDGADVVVELAGVTEGIDTVLASLSYRLTDNVENLTLTGTAFSALGNNLDNRLVGNSVANFLDGRAGADKMDGGAGNDTFVVDNLGDEVTDATGIDLVMTYVNMTLGGTIENLRLMGTNALNGTGNGLDNTVWANIGDNAVDGGSSNKLGDTLSFEFGATLGITFDLSIIEAQSTGGSGTDTARNFENLIGSNYDDLLGGTNDANSLDGLGGEDTITYQSAASGVIIDLSTQIATSGAGTDSVKNFENITGSNFDDVMTGDQGNNAFNGGAGTDTVTYQNVKSGEGGVSVSLAIAGPQNTLASGFDSFISVPKTTRSSIENLTGSINDDSLTGDAFNNVLDGSDGTDSLLGGGGNDGLIGGQGDDLLNGEGGTDTAYFIGADAARVSLVLTGAQNTGYGIDKLVSIENLVTGAGNDTLIGNTGSNSLDGGFGDDRIDGGAGDDFVYGKAGTDSLTGGAGADAFVFDTEFTSSGFDRITDFTAVEDTFQLENSIFTGLAPGELAGAVFAANKTGLAGDATDRIIYQTTTGNVYFDADGTGAGAAVQFAVVASGLTLTATDFFVI